MFAHPDEAAEVGAKELRTSTAFARRALDDTARMDILARDLALSDRSLIRVVNNIRAAGLLPGETAYVNAAFLFLAAVAGAGLAVFWFAMPETLKSTPHREARSPAIPAAAAI